MRVSVASPRRGTSPAQRAVRKSACQTHRVALTTGSHMNLLDVVLDTPRLTLRPLHTGDQQALNAGLREYYITDHARFIRPTPPKDFAQTKEFVERARQELVSGVSFHAAIERKGVDFLGVASMMHLNTPTPEFGVWIMGHQAGKGYGKEAASALLDWLRRHLTFEYVAFNVVAGNHAGVALARSLGGEELGERMDGTTRLVEFALR